MKNTMFQSAFKWCVAILVALLPTVTKAQNDTILYYNFSTNCTIPPVGWDLENVDGSCTWSGCNTGGVTQNNHTSAGCANAANDWLITPKINFDLSKDETITIPVGAQYSGGPLYISYSTNYPGTGDPTPYTWTTLLTYSSPNAGAVTATLSTSLTGLTGAGYIGFQYTSTGNATGQAARITIFSVLIKGTLGISITDPTVANIDSTSADIGANITSDGGTSIIERGITWSTSPNAIKGNSGVTAVAVSGTTGTYNTSVTGLPAGTKIYYRGYAINSTKTFYTTEQFFYTLSTEPSAYPTSFTAAAISKNSIKLDWTQVAGAQGYVIVQRVATVPTGLPQDATAYTNNQILGDGQIVGVINSGATTTTIVNGLIQGTRYYYTLFPYNYNLVNAETYNYRTVSPIPTANDSTWGYPPSHGSTIEGVTGSGVIAISSLVNDALVNDTTKGALAWRLQLKDGGSSLNDSDDLPTTVTSITLTQGANNTVTNWSTTIQSAGLFDDSTGALIKAATVTANSLVFSGINITAQDNNYRPLSVRVSLKKIAHIDKSRFHFSVNDANVITKTVYESSQTTGFTSLSDTLRNKLDVIATKLAFSTTLPTPIEAGAFIARQQIAATDTFNGADLDFNDQITITSVENNLIAGPRVVFAASGLAAFDTVRFLHANPSDTLVATAAGLIAGRSSRYVVENSKRSDIVVNKGFVYSQNIHHLDYKDTGAITTTNSLEVFGLYLRDGGTGGDNDFENTELTSVTFSVANNYILSKAALFSNGTKIAEVSNVGATLQFTGFSLIANDNDSVKLTLGVSFKDSAVDGHRLAFNITAATVTATGSLLAAANAGAAASSTIGDDNKIDITGSKLVFVKQPVNVARGNVMYPYVTVKAIDAAGNIDISGRAVTISTIGSTLNFSSINVVGVLSTKSVAEFSKLIFDVPGTGVKLVARASGLDSAISNAFDVLLPVWFRSVKSGNWSATSTWEYTTDFGTNWLPAVTVPDYSKHGYITIRSGHTVQMDGSTLAANTVDELNIEAGAVLNTPTAGSLQLTVNDAFGDDLLVEGKLYHNNSQSTVSIASPANILVKKGAAIELASFGDAADWAGNTNIKFEDSAWYIHNTSQPNSISAVTMFPNSAANEVPVFRVAQNYTYPGTFVNAANTLVINGLLSIDAAKTFTIGGGGERLIRNGIAGDGDLLIKDSAKTRITDVAQISGNGKIMVNSSKAVFQITATSQTQLLNDKVINSTIKNGISIAGELNGLANGFTGNATATIEANANIITANAQGIDGLFANTGTKNFDATANYVFNATNAQNSGTIAGNTARTITVDNTGGLTLTDDVIVTDSLLMVNGNITTSTSGLLTVAGVINGASATRYVNGPLKMWVDSAVTATFPVGKGIYAPVNYTTKDAAVWITLEYNNVTPNGSGYDTAKRGEGLAAIKANEYWTINSSTPVNGNVAVDYTTNSATNSVDLLNIRVVSWDGTQWVSEGPTGRTATATSVASDKLNNYTVFTIGLDSACTIPASPVFNTLNVCIGNPANLTATGNGTIRWYTNMNDDMPFAAGNPANAGIITSDTVFYTEVKNIGCISNRVAYPVKIIAIPVAPSITGTTQLCFNEKAQLTAGTGTYNWYGDVNATTPDYTGGVLVSANLAEDTSFYVEEVQNGCPSIRTRVDVIVRAQIQNPYSLGAAVCAGNMAVVKATANEDVNWFANTTTNVPFYTGEKYNTLTLFADTTFFLEAFEGNCKSQRVPVTINVAALPAAPVLSQPAVCEGGSVQITATATGKIYWYNDNTSTISVDSGATFNTPALINSRNYYASVFDGKCFSPKASSSVVVYAVPVNVAFTAPSSTGANQTTTVQTNTVAQSYAWDFGTDATPQTATGVGPHNVKWTTQGTKTVKLKVWNGNGAVACSTEITNTISVGPGLGIAGIENTQVEVYPNPINSGELSIQLGSAEKAVITVTDAIGRLVWKGEANSAATTVNVDGWAAGMYFMNISTANYNQTVKINKQ